MSPFQIVRLTEKDTEQTAHIANAALLAHEGVMTEEEKEKKLSPQKYTRAFTNPLCFYYGAFEGERLVGFCAGTFLKNPKAAGAIMMELFILPEYQRQGIGRDLMVVVESILFEKKDRIWLDAVRDSLGFFQKLGYSVKKNVPNLRPGTIVVEKFRPSQKGS